MKTSRYAEAFASPQGEGDARPTALQIIKDENLEGKLNDKVFLITGCSSGIGVETARAISKTAAKVFVTARDVPRTEIVLSELVENGQVEVLQMDLNSLISVREGAKAFLAKNKQLNVLICNAGIMAVPEFVPTADGFESQFGTNHLSHFLLFNLLKSNLLASSTPQFNSRVVMVSSSGHRIGGISPGNYDLKSEEDKYTPFRAYGQSKTANIYMANYIDREYGPQGLHATSLMPGGIATSLQKHTPGIVASFKDPKIQMILASTEQGAATTVLAAVGKEWEGTGGKYLELCSDIGPAHPHTVFGTVGYADHAFNEEKEKRLWNDSLKMVGLEK